MQKNPIFGNTHIEAPFYPIYNNGSPGPILVRTVEKWHQKYFWKKLLFGICIKKHLFNTSLRMTFERGCWWMDLRRGAEMQHPLRFKKAPFGRCWYVYLEPKWPLFWLEKALFWGGWPSKIEASWFLGIYNSTSDQVSGWEWWLKKPT